MPADLTLKAGDTEPSYADQLTYSNGEVATLTGATVTLIMRTLTASTPVALTGTATITKATAGEVAFTFSEADTSNPGTYMANWLVVFADGARMTFPTTGYLWFEIEENLATPGGAQIVSLPEVLDHLFIPPDDRTHDATLMRFIKGVQPLIENLTGPIIPTLYDEWYPGGHSTIALRHQPSYGYGTTPLFRLMAVSEYRGPIEYNLALVPTPTQGSVYSVMGHGELGTIVRRTSAGGTCDFWDDPSHPEQSIHVVYYVGQEEVPENVNMAALETIRWWYETTQQVGRGRQVAADAEVEGRPLVALPYHAEALLEPTRRAPVVA